MNICGSLTVFEDVKECSQCVELWKFACYNQIYFFKASVKKIEKWFSKVVDPNEVLYYFTQ